MAADLLSELQHGIAKERIPRTTISRHVKTDAQFQAAKNLLQVAVWERKLRVDLRYAVVVDEPLVPEEKDLLVELSRLFAR